MTDCNPVCAHSPVRTHAPWAENAVSISLLQSMGLEGEGGREGWMDGGGEEREKKRKGEKRQREKRRGDYRGAATVHSKHV